ncbi:Sensor histidine kinase RcsC [subsurface metagenome]
MESSSMHEILNSLDEAVLIIDQEYKIEFFNESASRLLNITRKKTNQKKCFEVLSNNEHPCEECPVSDLVYKKPFTSFKTCRIENVAYRVKSKIIDTDSGSRIIQIYQPLSSSKSEILPGKKNLPAQAGLEAFLDLLTLAGMITNSEGRIVFTNKKWLEAFGYKFSEIQNKEFQSIIAKTNQQEKPAIKRNFKNAALYDNEILFLNNRQNEQLIFSTHVSKVDINGSSFFLWILRNISNDEETKEEFKQREEYLRSIFRAAPVGIGVVVKRIFYFVNNRICEITGYRAAELLGQSERMVYPSEKEYKRVGEVKYKQIDEKGTGTIETKWKCKDGKLKDILLSSAPIDQSNYNRGVTFTALDITNRKEAEKKYLASEHKYKSLIETAADAIIIADAKTGKLVDANIKATELTGYSYEELVNMHQRQLHPPEIITEEEGKFKQIASGEKILTQTEVIHKSGRRIPVEINPSIYKSDNGHKLVIGFFRDLTQRIEWQKALEESELKYEIIFESVKEGIIIIDPETREFKYVNPAMCKFLGYSREELLNLTTQDIHSKSAYNSASGQINKVLNGEKDFAIDIPCMTKGRTTVHADVHATYITMREKIYIASFFNSTTERRKIELKLRTINKALEESKKNYQRLFDEMVNGFAVHEMLYNEKGEANDYRFLEVNPSFEKITGLRKKDLLNKNIKKVMPDVEESWIQRYGHVARTGKPVKFQEYSHVRNRHYEVTAYSPKEHIFATIVSDITDRVEASELLKTSEERYRKLVENSPNLMAVLKGHKFLYANPTAIKLLGYESFSELEKKETYSVLHPDYRKRVKKRMDVTDAGGKNKPMELVLLRKNGKTLIIESVSLAIKYNKEWATLILGIDITEKKHAEAKAREIQEAIENIQKGIASKVGEKFFETIVLQLAKILKADYAFVGELSIGATATIETISFCRGESILGNIKYELKGTPCDIIVKDGLCCHKDNLLDFYPDNRLFVTNNIIGYIGIPLQDSKGAKVGVLVALYKKPLNDQKFAQTILEIFSARIGAEIERRKSERELEKANTLFRTIAQNLPDIILRVDSDYRCTYVSHSVRDYAGISADEFLGKRLTQLDLDPEFSENREKDFAKILQNKKDYQTVLSLNTEKGRRILEWRMVPESTGREKVDSILSLIRDITESQRTETELNQLFNLSNDLICIADKKGFFHKINPAFENVLGYTQQELLSQPYFNFIHPDDLENTHKVNDDKLGKNIPISNFENRYKCKNGTYKWFSWVAQPLEEGMIFGIARDITDHRKAMKELIEAKEKAEESDKLKSTFLANMSHEIRTPMNAIMGFAALLQRGNLTEEKRAHFSNIIQNRGEDLLSIISDILDISKIDSGQIQIIKQEFSINKILRELYEEFLQKYKSDISESLRFYIEKFADENHDRVNNDSLRIRQVLTNLIDNALKFTTEGEVKFGCKAIDGMMQFYVSDTGIGIPKHKQQNIFERFRQVDESITRQYGGNGLGLAISRALVEMMGGDIWQESTEGKGSTFNFTIPHSQKKPVTKPVTEKLPDLGDINLKNRKLLVVEDDSLSQEFLRIVLEQAGAILTFAKSGGEALVVFESYPKFDMILMDIQLPDINGYEVTKRIRKINNKIPIIAQTAFAMSEDESKSKDAGCNEYLSKPVRADELLTTIHRVLSQC